MPIPLLAEGFEAPLSVVSSLGWLMNNNVLDATIFARTSVTNLGGSQSLKIDIAGGDVRSPYFNTATPTTSRWLFFHLRFGSTDTFVCTFRLTGGDQYSLLFDPDLGTIEQRRGNSGSTLVRTDPFAWAINTWYTIEVSLDAANAGRCQVFINQSATAASDTGAAVDTQALTSAGWNSFMMDIRGAAGGGDTLYVDDLLVFDSVAGRPTSNWYCKMVRPTGNGALIQWTPSAGANWENVDEATPDGTTYNSETTSGEIDRYTNGALGYTPTAILGIQECLHLTKAGTLQRGRANLLSGASTATGTYQDLSGMQFSGIYDFFDVDPATAAAWTVAAVNAVQVGPQAST